MAAACADGAPQNAASCIANPAAAEICVGNIRYAYVNAAANSVVKDAIQSAIESDIAAHLGVEASQVSVTGFSQGAPGTCFQFTLGGFSEDATAALVEELKATADAGEISLIATNDVTPDDAKEDPAETISGQASYEVPGNDDGEAAAGTATLGVAALVAALGAAAATL